MQNPYDITRDDIGRSVAHVRGIDWDWHAQPDGVIVLDVQTVYPCPGVCVKIGINGDVGHWYGVTDVRIRRFD